MLDSCSTGAARREIVLFYQTEVEFERYETGVFFLQKWWKESHEKNIISARNLDRKQESGEDTREYYTAKEKLWLHAYAPDKRSLVEFKDEMLRELYDEE